jgi:mono/diheme cytochrome c family protein
MKEKKMRPKANPYLRLALLIAGILESFSGFAAAQPMEVIAGGEIEYQRTCMICHGAEGRGDGIMRRYLTVQPANLRILAKANGGKFPFWDVYHKIDGETEVPAHGTREMPVWGDRFRAEAGSDGKAAVTQAAGRILSLTFYLEHIQDR